MAGLKIGLVLEFATEREWDEWLTGNHRSATEAWLQLAKKGTDAVTISRAEALRTALCYGWIDGQAASQDDVFWLQRFTPRRRRSKWSKINCDIAEELIRAGKMKPAGLAEVEAAKADGRWDAAYAPPSAIEVPEDRIDKFVSMLERGETIR